jgi:uncharacterized protein
MFSVLSELSDEQNHIIKLTEDFVKYFMKHYDDSHDFAHVKRVKNLATILAKSEEMTNDDIFEIQLGALTHDINDHKYTCDLFAQETILEEFFADKLDKETLENVIRIACNVSLSKETAQEHNNIYIHCKKLHCVQDADRIDSLGAIGLTRYFSYGMKKKNGSIVDIIKNIDTRTSILIQHIKTNMGKQIAAEKYQIIQSFLDDYKKTYNIYTDVTY